MLVGRVASGVALVGVVGGDPQRVFDEAGTLTINFQFNWSGGITSGGGTTVLPATCAGVFAGAGRGFYQANTIENNGTLTWTMGTAGYQFTTNGIAFTNNTGQFTSPTRAPDGLTFTWQDANTDLLTYNYNIAVQLGSQPHGILRLDPAIQNGTLNP